MFFLFILMIAGTFNVQEYLNEVKGFNANSYFKEQAYNDAKNFDSVKETKQLVDVQDFDIHLMNWCLFAATQEVRERANLSPLKFDVRLRNAAVIHTNEMVKRGFYDHINNRNSALKMPNNRMEICGVNSMKIAENIHNYGFQNNAVSYKDLARAIVKSFFASSGHKKNILDKQLNSLGCGAMFEKDKSSNRYFMKVTQCFAYLPNQ
ncbi:MAG TPA: CAP domain-containing protein [Chitinophagales bacterium]|nr:CAP domain-containing protein [Chitinophagales bacterium]